MAVDGGKLSSMTANSYLNEYVYKFSLVIFLPSLFHFQEKELLRKKREEIEEAEKAKRSRVVVTFDLVGRKVLNLSLTIFYGFHKRQSPFFI